jgi:hypothetical protein
MREFPPHLFVRELTDDEIKVAFNSARLAGRRAIWPERPAPRDKSIETRHTDADGAVGLPKRHPQRRHICHRSSEFSSGTGVMAISTARSASMVIAVVGAS